MTGAIYACNMAPDACGCGPHFDILQRILSSAFTGGPAKTRIRPTLVFSVRRACAGAIPWPARKRMNT